MERVGRGVAILDDADGVPVALRDFAVVAAGGDADGAALLLAGADLIWESVGDSDVVELSGGLVVPAAPGLSAVDTDERALVGDEEDDVGVGGVDPQVLVVVAAGCAAQAEPSAAAVGGADGDDAGDVDGIRVFGVMAGRGSSVALCQVAPASSER